MRKSLLLFLLAIISLSSCHRLPTKFGVRSSEFGVFSLNSELPTLNTQIPAEMVYEIKPSDKVPAVHAAPETGQRRWEWQITPEEEKKPKEEVTKEVPTEFVFPKKFEKPTVTPAPAPIGEKIDVTFNFQNADIREVIHVLLADLLKVNYVIDRKVAGAITLHAIGQFYREELMDIMQLTLNVNGFAMVVREAFVEVTTVQEARQMAPEVLMGDDIQVRGEDVITQIVPLEYIAPQGIIPTLRGFMTKAGFVVAPNDAHAIVISEQASNMERILAIIKMFDLPVFAGKALKFYDIKYVDVKGLAKELEGVAQSLGAVTKGARAEISFTPFAESNRLLVATRSPELLSTLDFWIQNIDVKSEERVAKLYIYKLQHQKAKDIQPVLMELYSEKISGQTVLKKPGAPKPPGEERKPGAPLEKTEAGAVIKEQPMRIIADESTNSLIIKALPADYQEIRSIIDALDASPQQVLIEVLIAEVKLTEAMQEGVELFLRNKLKTEPIGTPPVPTQVWGRQIDISNPAPAGSLAMNLFFGDVQTIFRILATETSFNFLSTPHVLVRDDQKASIQVADDVPIISSSTFAGIGATPAPNQPTQAAFTQQVQYRSVGILFTVTPHIAENGLVTLDIMEELSDFQKGNVLSSGGIDNPIFTTRKAETSMVIKGGNTVLIGGIIQEREDNKINKVPVLGDIPLLGYLFKSTDRKNEKTELLVLITPHVINTAEDAEVLTNAFEERVKSLQRMIKGKTIGEKEYYEKG